MEIYKQIGGLNYEVSNFGNVRNLTTKRTIKGGVPKSGYRTVFIRVGKNVKKNFLVHRLVAKAFILNPENKEQVNHINGNKLDNRVDNLEWVTPKENMLHAFQSGLYKKYNNQTYKNKFGKLHNRSIKLKCSNGEIYYGLSEAGRKLNLNTSTIYLAVKENRPIRSGLTFTKI